MAELSVKVKVSEIEEVRNIIMAANKLIEQVELYGYENPNLNKSLEEEQEFIDLNAAINKFENK